MLKNGGIPWKSQTLRRDNSSFPHIVSLALMTVSGQMIKVIIEKPTDHIKHK